MSSYHHGNLRATLIEQGVELARAQGPDGVVLREVARRADVSHNAAYRHFADRDELLGEIAAIGMQRLAEAMLVEMDGVSPPSAEARLRATGRAYVNFALAEPGLFAVAFAATTPKEPADAAVPETSPEDVPDPYALLGQALDELEAAGTLVSGRRAGAEVLCWSAVHGYAVLHLDGPLRDVPEAERAAGLEALLDQIERGLT